MCGNCKGEPYRGVRALFNGDLQAGIEFQDRDEWTIISPKVIVFLGESALKNEDHPLFRACNTAIQSLTISEQTALEALAKDMERPIFGGI